MLIPHDDRTETITEARSATDVAVQAATESLQTTRRCVSHSRRCLDDAREALARVCQRA